MAVKTVAMFGEGMIQGRPVSPHHIERRQPRIGTTFSLQLSWKISLK